MLTLAGWDADAALAGANKIFAFETELAKIHLDNVATRDADKTYNLTARAHLDALTPTFDWNIWLTAAKFEANVLAELNVAMPNFFEGLAGLWNNDHLEAIKLWLAWQVIRSSAPYLSDDFVNERFDFYGTKLTGAPMNRARWKRAVSLVEGCLGEAIGKIYVDKYFPAEAKTRMDELVSYLI
jgi:putative endopeptidase